jgi:O-6-methylguanine DNA methyltransferase
MNAAARGSFTADVYELVQQIPAGKVLTYKDVAARCGNCRAARAVGMAMHNNPDSSVVPCHRVVGSDGSLHDYAFGGIEAKRALLEQEGAAFNGQKVDLSKSRWALRDG